MKGESFIRYSPQELDDSIGVEKFISSKNRLNLVDIKLEPNLIDASYGASV